MGVIFIKSTCVKIRVVLRFFIEVHRILPLSTRNAAP